jgi:hypothetical protein
LNDKVPSLISGTICTRFDWLFLRCYHFTFTHGLLEVADV